jgi:uncharacterized membrane protein
MKNIFSLALVFSILAVTVLSCSKSSSNSGGGSGTLDCSTINAKFNADVFPIISTKCAINSGCHAAGSTTSGGPFTNYSQVSAKSSNIKTQVSSGNMPQAGSGITLTTDEKNKIICWVNSGAPNN